MCDRVERTQWKLNIEVHKASCVAGDKQSSLKSAKLFSDSIYSEYCRVSNCHIYEYDSFPLVLHMGTK